MANLGIVTNPLEFIKQIITDTPNSELPEIYKPVLRLYMYHIWRGAFESRRNFLQNSVQSDLSLLCMAVYKSLIPAIQLIRLGYCSDVLVLLRSIVERIALLDYLESNPNHINRYNKGKKTENLVRDAKKWAKPEWEKDGTSVVLGKLYGQMSDLVHSNIVGTAGHIVADRNTIGRAFRLYMKPEEKEEIDYYEASLIGLLFVIRAGDITTRKLFNDQNFKPILEDKDCLVYLTQQDLEQSIKVFQKWVEEGNRLLSIGH